MNKFLILGIYKELLTDKLNHLKRDIEDSHDKFLTSYYLNDARVIVEVDEIVGGFGSGNIQLIVSDKPLGKKFFFYNPTVKGNALEAIEFTKIHYLKDIALWILADKLANEETYDVDELIRKYLTDDEFMLNETYSTDEEGTIITFADDELLNTIKNKLDKFKL